jgi:hypothetical protein
MRAHARKRNVEPEVACGCFYCIMELSKQESNLSGTRLECMAGFIPARFLIFQANPGIS